ncbi:DUF2625 domain-containing protein [Paenibacillus sp. CAA11]|uniref:DUF2625 family protein n=1 Tax=Paenibacillus sp. CAA11 TaxID=1532905 RepID=UPI000D383A71|nr:DUF2625 family protein [Paenibacillus sp. CAA11]AWB44654.1 DUF2625 domain-containing protein [Paenibacillus sp. CAA11]
MHPLSVAELIDLNHHAWDEILDLFRQGANSYALFPANRESAEDTLYRLQVSTKSYLGAIALETGGVQWDSGWITLLGSGCDGIFGSLASWNGLQNPVISAADGLLVVAYDAAGGFFALDTGKFGRSGLIYYFAPDALEWESTDLQYSGFVGWLASGDLNLFYQTFRWKGWQEDIKQLEAGQVFGYYPPLWTEEGSGQTSKKAPISIKEAWNLASG